MNHVGFRETEGRTAGSSALIPLLAFVTLAGVLAGHHMNAEGHHVTGMNNRIVWGLSHVFAVFLIVAGSGALANGMEPDVNIVLACQSGTEKELRMSTRRDPVKAGERITVITAGEVLTRRSATTRSRAHYRGSA